MRPFIKRFHEIVQTYPHNTAIMMGGKHLCDYRTLADRAADLSQRLQGYGFGKGNLAAICIEKSPDYLVALLAIWMAEGAFVPLDPALPPARRDFILHEAPPKLIIHKEGKIEEIPSARRYPDALAYIIFTSGSTGEPKGVMVSHEGIMGVLEEQTALFQITHTSRAFLYLSISFDASLSDIGTAFLAGATLCLENGDSLTIAANLPHILQQNRVTHIDMPPSLLPLLKTQDMPDTLRTIIIGGEICAPEAIRTWAEKYRVINVYGPTEATICTSMEVCTTDWNDAVIGKPISTVTYCIMDAEAMPVQAGMAGELFISGKGVALGYVNNPDLSAQKFNTINGIRYYRSGDLVKENTDGKYIYLGRIDRQFKIHGQLVAPEEIEAAIERNPLVRRAAVTTQYTDNGQQKVNAFVEVAGGITINTIRRFLKHQLPSWMLPHFIHICDKLPKSDTGKIDYSALRKSDFPQTVNASGAGLSEDAYTATLRHLWKKVLGLSALPNTDEDFFEDLGGDSFNAIEMIVAAEREAILLPTGILAELRNIRDVVSWLKSNDGHSMSDAISANILKKEINMELLNFRPVLGDAKHNHVLLTGATGFLGIHVLSEILYHTNVYITCLVRAPDETMAEGRLREKASQYGLSLKWKRIRVIAGDISLPQLGLAPNIWQELAEKLSAIYHCAAEVNMMKGYHELKAANYTATEEIVRLASSGNKKAIHFASTLSVFVGTDHNSGICSENDNLETTRIVYGGYAQSKWLAEYFLRQITYLPMNIFRFGLITGHSETGNYAPHDFFRTFITGLCKMGSLPEGDWSSMLLDATPVDYAAGAMVRLSLMPQGECYHIVNKNGFSLEAIVECLKKLGINLTHKTASEWEKNIIHIPETAAAYMALCRLTAEKESFDRYRAMDLFQATNIKFDQENTQRALSGSGFECPQANEVLLGQYIKRILNV